MRHDETVAEVRLRAAASPSRVFAAFSDAGLVSRWLKPSPEVALTVLEFNFRVGGAYRFAYAVPGRGTMFVNGVYRTIQAPTTIVFSWNIEPPDEHAGVCSEVTITLAPHGSGTDLLIRHEQLTAPGAAQRHTAGWQGALEHLIALLSDVPESATGRLHLERGIE
jgi:uncharacterized protein YndB with AHSA1/START domain